MRVTRVRMSVREFLPELTRLENEPDRQALLSRHPELVHAEVLEELAPLVVEHIRMDPQKALRLAEAAVLIAEKLGSKEAEALALRAKANALHACGENRVAVEHHNQAYQIYASCGNWREAARTLSSSIQPLILVGEYERACAASKAAQETFVRLGEGKRLASLENNIGNILHRQDRFEEALARYERAYQELAIKNGSTPPGP
jgi:tetratricopeptide (TPR) repeat protein